MDGGDVTYKGTEEDINDGNESLCEEHGLPEIQGLTHLGQKGDEQQSSGVGV